MAGPRNTNATTNGSSVGRMSDTAKTCVNRRDGYLFHQIFLGTWDDSHTDAHFANEKRLEG